MIENKHVVIRMLRESCSANRDLLTEGFEANRGCLSIKEKKLRKFASLLDHHQFDSKITEKVSLALLLS